MAQCGRPKAAKDTSRLKPSIELGLNGNEILNILEQDCLRLSNGLILQLPSRSSGSSYLSLSWYGMPRTFCSALTVCPGVTSTPHSSCPMRYTATWTMSMAGRRTMREMASRLRRLRSTLWRLWVTWCIWAWFGDVEPARSWGVGGGGSRVDGGPPRLWAGSR